MYFFSLIKWKKGNVVGKDPTLMVSLEGETKCVRTTRFSWVTPSHVPNPQENPQVQEVLEDVSTSINSLEAHPHIFPTIKRSHKFKKYHSQKIWTSVLLARAWVPPCPCGFSSGSITWGREYDPPNSFQELHVLMGSWGRITQGCECNSGLLRYTLMCSWTSREPMTLETSMYSWVLLTENHLKSCVWLSSLEAHPHTFPNLKRTHKFGKLHVLPSTSRFLSSMGTYIK